jgi:type IV pilus assembly protein PilA
MIVVAIIGVLASIAIPSYQDYTAKAQVSEAMMLTSGLKTPVAEYISDNGGLPSALASISSSTSGNYVSSIAMSGNATTVTIDAIFPASGVSGALLGQTFVLMTNDGGGTWDCGESTLTASRNSIDSKYLPAGCR